MYEFFEAVDEKDDYKMKEELGDLLLQIVLHSRMAEEEGKFSMEDVAYEICEKLIRRHPHVFGETQVSSSTEVIHNWERIKKGEKGKEHRKYLVDDIPEALPALFKAEKMQRRVARVGFDWKDTEPVFDKVEEEFREFREAILKGDQENADEELGDILFALVNAPPSPHKCRRCPSEDYSQIRQKVPLYRRQVQRIREGYLHMYWKMDRYWRRVKRQLGDYPAMQFLSTHPRTPSR